MKALFVIDAGGASGVACGVFDEKSRTIEDAVRGRIHSTSWTLNHRKVVGGRKVQARTDTGELGRLDDMEQACELYGAFMGFKRRAVREWLMDPDDVELVLEDFTLMPGRHSGGKEGISPVRIAWAIAGIQVGRYSEFARRHKTMHVSDIIWQEPNMMGVAPDSRLRALDLWIPGRDHERAAWRHLIARLNKLIR